METSLPNTVFPAANGSIVITSYNMLADIYCRPELYTNTPRWALDWKYRRDRLKHQIDGRGSDLFCLQEVEKGEYDKYWLKAMQEKGYDGLLR